jgi:hypothetical protein
MTVAEAASGRAQQPKLDRDEFAMFTLCNLALDCYMISN